MNLKDEATDKSARSEFPGLPVIFRLWATYLSTEPARDRLSHMVSMYSPEAWLALECSWATRCNWESLRLGRWRMIMERHLPGLPKRSKADLIFIPSGKIGLQAVADPGPVFEFKIAWAESPKTMKETIDGLRSDIETRASLAEVASVILGFAFEWGQNPPHGLFRRQPRSDRVRWTTSLEHLREESSRLGLRKIGEDEWAVDGPDEEGIERTRFWLSMYKHPR